MTTVNGEPGLVFRSGDAGPGRCSRCGSRADVRAVYITANPDKLGPLGGGRGRISTNGTTRRFDMKIVVIGGSGLIGKKLVPILTRAGPRGRVGVPVVGRQHPHRRGAGRGARGRPGRRGRVELAVLGGRRGDGVLRDLDRQPAGRGEGRRRGAPRRPVGGRGRPHAGQRVHAGQGRPGEADQGRRGAVHDRPGHAVLRVPRRDRRDRATATRSGSRPPPCSRWRPTTWRPPWPMSP